MLLLYLAFFVGSIYEMFIAEQSVFSLKFLFSSDGLSTIPSLFSTMDYSIRWTWVDIVMIVAYLALLMLTIEAQDKKMSKIPEKIYTSRVEFRKKMKSMFWSIRMRRMFTALFALAFFFTIIPLATKFLFNIFHNAILDWILSLFVILFTLTIFVTVLYRVFVNTFGSIAFLLSGRLHEEYKYYCVNCNYGGPKIRTLESTYVGTEKVGEKQSLFGREYYKDYDVYDRDTGKYLGTKKHVSYETVDHIIKDVVVDLTEDHYCCKNCGHEIIKIQRSEKRTQSR